MVSHNAGSGSAATIRDLPPELFHNILDQLSCHDPETISTCSLVCRDWLEISRDHLFSEFHYLRDRDESFEDLAVFLETYPGLAKHIRTLSLEARLFSIPPRSSLMPAITSDLLCRIVRSVPHLHALRLRQLRITLSPPQSSDSTQKINIEHLEYEKCISEVATTFALLSMFHIGHLDFEPLFEDADLNVQLEFDAQSIDVCSLCIDTDKTQLSIAFKALQKVIPPSMLKSFRYPSPDLVPQPVAAFLQQVGQNIIDLDFYAASGDDCLVLPQLPRLQVFRYHPAVSLLTSPADLERSLALAAPLRTFWVPHLPADLEELVLYVTYGDARLAPGEETMPLWGVDAAPATRFRRLKKLAVCFPTIPVPLAKAVATTTVCFPECSARGVLDVTVKDWDLECRDVDLYGYLRDC